MTEAPTSDLALSLMLRPIESTFMMAITANEYTIIAIGDITGQGDTLARRVTGLTRATKLTYARDGLTKAYIEVTIDLIGCGSSHAERAKIVKIIRDWLAINIMKGLTE